MADPRPSSILPSPPPHRGVSTLNKPRTPAVGGEAAERRASPSSSELDRFVGLVPGEEILAADPPEAIRLDPALQTWAPRVPESGIDFNGVVERFENDLIAQALARTHWNKNRAARLLGLNRTTLVEKIKKRGLKPPAPLR